MLKEKEIVEQTLKFSVGEIPCVTERVDEGSEMEHAKHYSPYLKYNGSFIRADDYYKSYDRDDIFDPIDETIALGGIWLFDLGAGTLELRHPLPVF